MALYNDPKTGKTVEASNRKEALKKIILKKKPIKAKKEK